ncbi:hypothetical protein [Mycobacterium lepromatosis]|uniref:hypothetical protein n=1 Tax=Mycobacterium lepromatosis TaxID=480418 RepID=UPI0005F83557|nr:hypothetical protein [Mycobacterium lepromatosis]
MTQADNLPIGRILPILTVIAETMLTVRQLNENAIAHITEMLDNDSPYAAHGHLVRLRIRSLTYCKLVSRGVVVAHI